MLEDVVSCGMRKVIRHGTNLIFEDEKKWRGIIGMTQPFLSGPSATVKLVLIDTLSTICSKVDRVHGLHFIFRQSDNCLREWQIEELPSIEDRGQTDCGTTRTRAGLRHWPRHADRLAALVSI